MNQSIRDQILEALARIMGYDRDRGSTTASAICREGVISNAVEGDEELIVNEYGTDQFEMLVDVQRVNAASSSTVTASQANALLAELVAIIPDQSAFSPLVVDQCHYESGGAQRRGDGSQLVGARVAVRLVYRTDHANPYQLSN